MTDLENDPRRRIIPAIDVDELPKAAKLVQMIGRFSGPGKYGLELCNAEGTPRVAQFGNRVGRTFLDLKHHDIPNTVMKAIRVLAKHRVMMTNLHALGGPKMMKAAAAGRDQGEADFGHRTLVLAVTLLTSHKHEDGVDIGLFQQDLAKTDIRQQMVISDFVLKKTEQAIQAGLDGVICSPLEVPAIRERFGDVMTVCPAIRSLYYPSGDQGRPVTPLEAAEMGVTYMVAGRQVTEPAPILASVYDKPVDELTSLDALNAMGDEMSGKLVVKSADEVFYV